MVLDVNRLNYAGFDDILALRDGSIIASHSNCRTLCAHPRNLTDDQIVKLAHRGGVIGINEVRSLAKQPGSKGTRENLYAHVLRIERLAGSGLIGLDLDISKESSLLGSCCKVHA